MRRQYGPWLLAVLLFVPTSVGVGAAHDLDASQVAPPIPLDGLYVGVGTVVVLALFLAWWPGTTPTLSLRLFSIPVWLTRPLYIAGRTVFTFYLAYSLYQGLVGTQVASENAATLFIWPVWVVGLALFAVVFGNPWRALSPWRGLHAALERLEGSDIRARAYPAGLGVWPATLGIVLLGAIVELTAAPQSPALTVGLVVGYAAVMLGGSLVFGAAWFQHADVLEVLYAQFARLAPIHTDPERGTAWTVSLRSPWSGSLDAPRKPGMAVFALAVAYTVLFDPLTDVPRYGQLHTATRDVLGSAPLADAALYLGGLLAVLAVYVATVALVESLGHPERGTRAAAGAFAPAVVPVAASNWLAHYYVWTLLSLDRVTDIVVPALAGPYASLAPTLPNIAYTILALPAFWASRVGILVFGFLVALLVARGVARARYPATGRARLARTPLIVVLAAYTVLSLWFISPPIVAG